MPKRKLALTCPSFKNMVHGTWRHRSHGPRLSAKPGKYPFRYGGTGVGAERCARMQVTVAAQTSKKMNLARIPCILLLEFIISVFLECSRNCRSSSPKISPENKEALLEDEGDVARGSTACQGGDYRPEVPRNRRKYGRSRCHDTPIGMTDAFVLVGKYSQAPTSSGLCPTPIRIRHIVLGNESRLEKRSRLQLPQSFLRHVKHSAPTSVSCQDGQKQYKSESSTCLSAKIDE